MAVRRSVHKWRENCPRKDGRKSVIIRNGRTNEPTNRDCRACAIIVAMEIHRTVEWKGRNRNVPF